MILRSVVRRAALQNHSAGHPSSAIGQLSLHDMWIMNYKKTKKKKTMKSPSITTLFVSPPAQEAEVFCAQTASEKVWKLYYAHKAGRLRPQKCTRQTNKEERGNEKECGRLEEWEKCLYPVCCAKSNSRFYTL